MGPGSRSRRSLVRDDEIDSIFKQPIPVILRSIAKAMRLEGRRGACSAKVDAGFAIGIRADQ
jgi:hypothetical protein